jgi:hypothetical protein
VIRAAVAVAIVGCVAGSAAAEPGTWRTVAVPTDGFTVAVPASWQVVPRSTPRLEALIADLRKRKRTTLALQLAQIAAARRATDTVYRFQAIAWPPPAGAIVPDVTVKTDALAPDATAAALPAIAKRVAQALSRAAGATAAPPVARRLPAGRAYAVVGTTRITKSLRSRYAIYLLVHARTLYSVAFRGPETRVEGEILRRFRFVA